MLWQDNWEIIMLWHRNVVATQYFIVWWHDNCDIYLKKLVVTSIPIHFLYTGWTSTAAVRMFLCHIWISSQPGCMTGNRLCGMSSTWAFSEICTLLRCSNYVPRLCRDKVMGRRSLNWSDPVQTAVGGAAICDIAAPGRRCDLCVVNSDVM